MDLKKFGSLKNTKTISERGKIIKEEFKEFYRKGNVVYECSNFGRIRRICRTTIYYLKPYLRNCYEYNQNRRHSVVVKIDRKEFNCRKLIAGKFIRPLRLNEVVISRNGNIFDLNVKNLFIITRSNLGKNTGGKTSKAKKIYYYDNLNYRHTYPSARNLAKYLGVSYQTVLNIANGKTKNPKFNVKWCENEETIIQNP